MNFKKEMNLNVYIAAATGLGLLAAGGLGGWLGARAYLSRDFEKQMAHETEAIRLHYINKAAKEASPADVLAEATEDDSPAPDLAGDFSEAREWAPESGDAEEAQEAGSRNIFDTHEAGPAPGEHAVADDASVDESGEDDRDHSRPYPIAPHEYANTEPGWEAIALTYYAGDGVLVDDKGEPVPNYVKLIGTLTPEHFGGISGEKNLRLVRNDERECDFEITMHEGTYAEVLGYGRPQ